MSSEKDIRFSDKKVDESWKAQLDKEKDTFVESKQAPKAPASQAATPQTSKPFLELLSSLAYQVMMFFREVASYTPEQIEQAVPEIEGTVQLLKELKAKSVGNLSAEEESFFEKILPELENKASEL